MSTRLRSRLASEEGQVLPMIALMLTVLIGFLALAVDVGNGYLHKRRLQAAVDLGLVSAAQSMPNTATATDNAKSYVDENWHKRDDTTPAKTVTTGCMANTTCTKPNSISMSASVSVPTHFLKLFGIDHWDIGAKGTACGPCDTSVAKFDVMVVLDRSYSMCLNSSGGYNGCSDLKSAVDGIKSLLGFFNPATDRVGLTLLSSGDDHAPFDHAGSGAPTCDTADPGDGYASGKGAFYGTLGDFMDGTPANHDTWVVAPMSNAFKNSDGSLNTSSPMVSTLNCVQPKYWTPIAPAIQEATSSMLANKRDGAKQFLIYMGDGGANVQPMKRDDKGNALPETSWYTPSSGNNLKPCHDAVAQAARAKANGIEVYSIGYDLNASGANRCVEGNDPGSGNTEGGIDARSAMLSIASDPSHFYEKATAGEVYTIFNAIGHEITGSGVRLTG